MKNIIITTLFLLLGSNAFACYDKSLDIMDNYDNCLVDAEEGVAEAQFVLGLMYYTGRGVAHDYREAVRWYTKAAKQGIASAQYNLGVVYGNGHGVAQDYKCAYMWWDILASSGEAEAVKNRDILAKEMTPSQIGKAQDMAREWMAKHQ